MFSIHFYFYLVLFYGFLWGSRGGENVPALIWASKEYQERPYLILDQIKSQVFESYAREVLADSKPLLVVFLEENLGSEDFARMDDSGTSFPFLVNLSQNYRVDYLRSVETPYQVIRDLTKEDEWKEWPPETEWPNSTNLNKTGILVRFEGIDSSSREENLKRHDAVVERIHRNLMNSGFEWICMYTGRSALKRDLVLAKPLSPWHVREEPTGKPKKVLSLFHDEHTGLTMILRGVVQLFLPGIKNFAVVHLENHCGVSEKYLENGNRFVVRFPNYTLTFSIRKVDSDWIINKVRITNENGDSLNLSPKSRYASPADKCTEQVHEFQSIRKPLVRIKLSKYKFIRFPFEDEACASPYSFHVVSSFMFLSVATIVIFWETLLKRQNFTRKSTILTISSKTLQTTDKQISATHSTNEVSDAGNPSSTEISF